MLILQFRLLPCNYKVKGCRFLHPQEICKEYMESLKCEKAECRDRHPKMCKYLKYRGGCKRGIECDFLHVTPVSDDGINTNHLKDEYNCSGCK